MLKSKSASGATEARTVLPGRLSYQGRGSWGLSGQKEVSRRYAPRVWKVSYLPPIHLGATQTLHIIAKLLPLDTPQDVLLDGARMP